MVRCRTHGTFLGRGSGGELAGVLAGEARIECSTRYTEAVLGPAWRDTIGVGDVGGRDQPGKGRAHGEDHPVGGTSRAEKGVLIRLVGIAISTYVAVTLARAIHHRRAGQRRSSALTMPMACTIPEERSASAPAAVFRPIRIASEPRS